MVRAVIVGIALLILPLARAQTERLNRGVSTSRQFICYAANPLLPASLGYFAEQVKREWLYTLDAPDEWRDPVVLLVTARSDANQAAASPALRVFQTDLHLKYQVTWLTPPGLEQPTVVLAIVESLCAELANRNEDASVAKPYRPAPVPHWLTYGLARVIQGRDERPAKGCCNRSTVTR